MKKVGILFLLFYISFSGTAQPVVDGFLKGKGNVDFVGGYYFDSYKNYYAYDGLIGLKRNTQIISFYAAGGITKWLDAQVSIPFVITGSNKSFQDVAVYLKAALLNKKLKKGKLSVFYSPGISFPANDYPTEGLYALGQKATLIDQRLAAQYFFDNGFFIMGQSGYSYRLSPVPSSLPIALKIGIAKEKFYIDAWFDYQYAKKGNSYRDGYYTSFRNFKVSYNKVGATLYKPFNNKLGASVGSSYVLNGENVGKSMGFSMAIIVKC